MPFQISELDMLPYKTVLSLKGCKTTIIILLMRSKLSVCLYTPTI